MSHDITHCSASEHSCPMTGTCERASWRYTKRPDWDGMGCAVREHQRMGNPWCSINIMALPIEGELE